MEEDTEIADTEMAPSPVVSPETREYFFPEARRTIIAISMEDAEAKLAALSK